MSTLTEKVDFSRLRYANCWEGADVLLSQLKPESGSTLLCIASGGDNALALLSTEPAKVVATDLSAPQLYLTALKQMAIVLLDYDEMLELLGIRNCPQKTRNGLYHKLRNDLPADARHYWDNNQDIVATGVIHAGKFERYFRMFREHILPLVHTPKAIHELLEAKTDLEQQEYYRKSWNTWRWRMVMNLFFSKTVMGKWGRDPEFLRQVKINVPQYIRRKTEAHLSTADATVNYFLHYILTGAFSTGLPFYLRPEHFAILRSNINRLVLQQQDAHNLIAKLAFDGCCLSNIFEYVSDENFANLAGRYAAHLLPGAKIAFWNLMAPRSFSEQAPDCFREVAVYPIRDKGFFYSRFLLAERL
jgi:S-adenosylmethionine-diacylglycerol 3-amino-3-carboxypropyl transferase